MKLSQKMFEKIDTIEQENSYLKQKNQYLELELRKANERMFTPFEILHRTIEIQKENLDKKDAEIANLKKQRDEYNEGAYNYIKEVVFQELNEENKNLTKCKESAKLKINELEQKNKDAEIDKIRIELLIELVKKTQLNSERDAQTVAKLEDEILKTRREAMIMAKEMMKLRPVLKAHFDSDAWNIAERIAR